jgi:hypothetical protein
MAKWIMPTIEGVAFVMESITFIEFIQEEAIQSCALAAFMAIRSKRYDAARQCLDILESTLIYHLELVNEAVGPLAPYSVGCFADFVTSAKLSAATMRSLLLSAPGLSK